MTDRGQVNKSAAQVYDEFFVPALFGTWPPQVIKAAGLNRGMSVLDVACGSGVLALEAERTVGPTGRVVGLDPNEGMLDVARGKTSNVVWQNAAAEALPYQDESFDSVISQFGLMFFADKPQAASEMWRVLRGRGRLVVAVWDALEQAPGYQAVTVLLSRLFGDDVADLLRAPYSLGDVDLLTTLFREATGADVEARRVPGSARYPSIRDWMHMDVWGWTLSDRIDDEQYEQLVKEAERELAPFVRTDGSVEFEHPALFVIATKR